jgi:hypothetical protein
MPTLSTVFERELHDLTRAALQLEKHLRLADSIPSPVRYQQILNGLSDLHRLWSEYSIHRVAGGDGPTIKLEQQFDAIHISGWPRSTDAGLMSLRVAVPRILILLYQQIARERAALAERLKVPSIRIPTYSRAQTALKIVRSERQVLTF